jgi:N-acetylneuraminate synthase
MDLAGYRRWEAPPYVVAEAGVNHGGDLATAREMVAAAGRAGVDAIKFQTYSAGRLAVRDSTAYWDRAHEPAATQHELFSRYDALREADYRLLAADAAEHGIDFLSTPFDVESVGWLAELTPLVKVASADVTNHPLLRRVAATGRPVALSTGASTLDEVAAAVALLEDGGAPAVALLQCTLSYPTATADAAIGGLVALRERFPEHALGYSDHTLPADSLEAIAAAWALGARIVEKHFTLDPSLPGNDHYHAFDPEGFARLRARLDQTRALLGGPSKDVLAAEEAARTHARRSLVARAAILAGTVLTEELLDVKRPGTGIAPTELAAVLGARAAADIPADAILTWSLLERAGG